MKTTKEWIDTLPADIRERAYKHTEERWLKKFSATLRDCILDAFSWNETPEKHIFWSLVAESKFEEARQLLTKNTTKP